MAQQLPNAGSDEGEGAAGVEKTSNTVVERGAVSDWDGVESITREIFYLEVRGLCMDIFCTCASRVWLEMCIRYWAQHSSSSASRICV